MKKQEPKKLERVTLTLQEWWHATRKQVQRNRKKYTRKTKHRNG